MDIREVPRAPFVRHPWERARFRFFRTVLREAGVLRAGARMLDVGAGDAWLAAQLVASGPPEVDATCWDAAYADPAQRARAAAASPALRLVSEQPAGTFDALLLLDVLEHVADDGTFLGALLRENARPDTAVLVSVPAHPALWGPHDLALRHYRRYSASALAELLAGAGLVRERGGGLFHSLMLPRLLQNARDRWVGAPQGSDAPPDGGWRGTALSAHLVELALRADTAVSRAAARAGVGLPGLSLWALCHPG